MWVLAASSASSSASSVNDRGVVYHLMTGLFGMSDAQAHTVQIYTPGPLRILLIVVIALVLSRFVARLAGRLMANLRLVSPLVRATPRGEDRVKTLAGVFASIFRTIIWVLAILAILGELRINLIPFVATATVVGAALGFGAQSLVKDFLSGVLILAEDQYGIGDHIIVGTGVNAIMGTVESVNLRVTRLRAVDGVVWYVPNGDIREVGNDTENDSQALIDVVVPNGTDLERAGEIAEATARSMMAEDEWVDAGVSEPVFVGAQATSDVGTTLRVTVWCHPGQHFRVAREMRMRILEALRKSGVAWAGTTSEQS